MAEETAVVVAWILTVIVLMEVASEEEALAEMNSEIAVVLQAVGEVVEASIKEKIFKVATTKIRTLTLGSRQEAEETGALATLRGQVASTSLTISKGNQGALVEEATQVSGRMRIDLRQWVEAAEGPCKDKTTHQLGTSPSERKKMSNLCLGLILRKTLQVQERIPSQNGKVAGSVLSSRISLSSHPLADHGQLQLRSLQSQTLEVASVFQHLK